MKRLCPWIVVGLSACTSVPPSDVEERAEITVATVAECEQTSAVVRELRAADGKAIRTNKMPARVSPGVYAIGVSCGTLFDGDTATCVDSAATRGRNDVAPYELVLRAKRRYVFSCSQRNGQSVIRLDEVAL